VQVSSSLDRLYTLKTAALRGPRPQDLLSAYPQRDHADWCGPTRPRTFGGRRAVTGSFGERIDPFNGEGAFHSGVDIRLCIRSIRFVAPADGIVDFATSWRLGRASFLTTVTELLLATDIWRALQFSPAARASRRYHRLPSAPVDAAPALICTMRCGSMMFQSILTVSARNLAHVGGFAAEAEPAFSHQPSAKTKHPNLSFQVTRALATARNLFLYPHCLRPAEQIFRNPISIFS